jgi:hypothetical protein
MGQVARGSIKTRPISLGKRVTSNSEVSYEDRILIAKGKDIIGPEIMDRILASSEDYVVKVNVINALMGKTCPDWRVGR